MTQAMVASTPVLRAAPSITCPVCREAEATCEVCLHQHMMAEHGVRYSQAFGTTPDGWAQPCPTCSGTAETTLGL